VISALRGRPGVEGREQNGSLTSTEGLLVGRVYLELQGTNGFKMELGMYGLCRVMFGDDRRGFDLKCLRRPA